MIGVSSLAAAARAIAESSSSSSGIRRRVDMVGGNAMGVATVAIRESVQEE